MDLGDDLGPLLGIPGVALENACGEYYEDAEQFRPLPPNRALDLEPLLGG